jgi:preprotein translocase subunit YajC
MIDSTTVSWIAQTSGSGSLIMNLLPMLAIFAIFYFLLIAPMRKRQKKLQELIENLKRGDKVVTNGGIYGEVAAIEGSTLLLKIAENTKVRITKSAIAGLEGDSEGGAR